MPCRNAKKHLKATISSVFNQPECLELIVADGGSTDGSLQVLVAIASTNPKLRIICRNDSASADALNKTFCAARGTLIGLLNADDLMPQGALTRAVSALHANPGWVMVCGEGEEFNEETGLVKRYPTLPISIAKKDLNRNCFICHQSVVFRRSMGLLLREIDQQWRTTFDFDYWIKAFRAFPNRIGYIPHLQGRTRIQNEMITSKYRAQASIETTRLLAHHFKFANVNILNEYALELMPANKEMPKSECFTNHLKELFDSARPYLAPAAFSQLQKTWLTAGTPQVHLSI